MKPDPLLQPVAFMQAVVAEEFGLPRRIMKQPARKRGHDNMQQQHARQAAYFVCRMLSERSTLWIAQQFNRDPRTFSHGVQRTWERIQLNEDVRERVCRAVERITKARQPMMLGEAPCIETLMRFKETGDQSAGTLVAL